MLPAQSAAELGSDQPHDHDGIKARQPGPEAIHLPAPIAGPICRKELNRDAGISAEHTPPDRRRHGSEILIASNHGDPHRLGGGAGLRPVRGRQR